MSKLAKTSEYSSKDLLVLSQAFIRTSENAIEGADRKKNKFWDEVAVAYNLLKKQQESYDNRLRKKNRYNQVLLRGDFLSSNEEDDEECVVPPRTASSFQQKWSKSVLPLDTKFISLANRYPMQSGEGESPAVDCCLYVVHQSQFFSVSDRNRYYNRVHLIFLEQNPAISSFDLYHPAWEFLKDSIKNSIYHYGTK
jgi:hypothetical protein